MVEGLHKGERLWLLKFTGFIPLPAGAWPVLQQRTLQALALPTSFGRAASGGTSCSLARWSGWSPLLLPMCALTGSNAAAALCGWARR